MGEIRVKATLQNEGDLFVRGTGKRRKVRSAEVNAIVDTGAVLTLLPQEIVELLGLKLRAPMIVQLANDQKIELPTAGGLLLTVAGREMSTDCLVGPPGCEPLLGQIVMERLDLIADPARRTLTPRPESPYRPTLKLKSAVAA